MFALGERSVQSLEFEAGARGGTHCCQRPYAEKSFYDSTISARYNR
jgi:hypothetical protein